MKFNKSECRSEKPNSQSEAGKFCAQTMRENCQCLESTRDFQKED